MSESGGSRRPDARRVLDLALGSLGLAASLPILAAAAAGMHLAGDHGPFLFRARRVGAGGSAITVLKIRTMREGPTGIGLTSAGDPRITWSDGSSAATGSTSCPSC